MNLKKIFLISISVTGLIVLMYSLLINFTFGRNKRTKGITDLLENKQKLTIKKYLLPYQLIKKQENKIVKQEELIKVITPYLAELEIYKIKEGSDIEVELSEVKLNNNKILKKYKLTSGFYSGINNKFPGSGFIDFNNQDIFILSSRGLLAFREESAGDTSNFKLIKNNIHNYIDLKQFKKSYKISLKDLLISNGKIYISYNEEIQKNCWNTSVLSGNLDYKEIEFKKLFSPKECVHRLKNLDSEFEMHQSGGRIVALDNNNLLLTIGDYRSRHLAQNKKSINGKIIKLNINNKTHKILSMGHRNPQGLYYDNKKNFLLSTEHGPMGGDEINMIKINDKSINKIPNYGWAISSEGEHYGGISEKRNQKKYKKYPLYNSHEKHGFIEPLKSFTPSIGISEIAKIKENHFVVSSLKDKSLYFFRLNNTNKIYDLVSYPVFERIRDLKIKDNKLFLFMEDTASIGVINLIDNSTKSDI